MTANGPIVEGASFGLQPVARYSITFVSKDLPSGVWWTMSLDGVQYSSSTSTLTVSGLYVHNAAGGIGTYKFGVGVRVRERDERDALRARGGSDERVGERHGSDDVSISWSDAV